MTKKAGLRSRRRAGDSDLRQGFLDLPGSTQAGRPRSAGRARAPRRPRSRSSRAIRAWSRNTPLVRSASSGARVLTGSELDRPAAPRRCCARCRDHRSCSSRSILVRKQRIIRVAPEARSRGRISSATASTTLPPCTPPTLACRSTTPWTSRAKRPTSCCSRSTWTSFDVASWRAHDVRKHAQVRAHHHERQSRQHDQHGHRVAVAALLAAARRSDSAEQLPVRHSRLGLGDRRRRSRVGRALRAAGTCASLGASCWSLAR